jgi:hypothetical protein
MLFRRAAKDRCHLGEKLVRIGDVRQRLQLFADRRPILGCVAANHNAQHFLQQCGLVWKVSGERRHRNARSFSDLIEPGRGKPLFKQ